jgi:hypothetical protein
VQVVFLDIDGVLNCKTTSNPRKFPYVVDKKLLARLAQLLKRTKAKVVLSSTWRYDPVGLMAAKYWGVPFIDVTPDMPHRARRDEIRTWLKKHKDVTRFIVIDDDDDELDDLPLFQPSSDIGLTTKITRGACKYLLGKTNEDMRHPPIQRIIENIRTTLQGHKG